MIQAILHGITVRAWIKKLRTADWRVRVQAAEKLAALQDRRAVSALIEALSGSRNSPE